MKNTFNHHFLLSNYFLIPIIFIIGIALRCIHLDYSSLDLDDVYSIYYAHGSWQHLAQIFPIDINPPTYYITLFAWFSVFDDSVFNARFLSVIISAFTGVFIWVFASKHFNKVAALIAVSAFLLSNYQLSISHLVRTFAMSELFAMMSFYFFIEVINHQKKSSIIFYIITTSVLLNTHGTTFLVPLIQFILLFTFKWNKKKIIILLISQFVISLSIVPQILLYNPNKNPSTQLWRMAPSFNNVITTLEIITGSTTLLYCYAFALFFCMLILIKKQKLIASKEFLPLIFWIVLGFLFAFISSQKVPFFSPKYLTTLTPPLYLLLGGILAYLLSKSNWFLIVIGFIFYMSFIKLNFKSERAENWKKVVPIAKELNENGYDILVSPVYMYRPFTFYFDKTIFHKTDSIMPILYHQYGIYFSNTIDTNFFDYRFPKKLVLVQSQAGYVDPKKETIKVLNTFFPEHKKITVDGIDLHLYER